MNILKINFEAGKNEHFCDVRFYRNISDEWVMVKRYFISKKRMLLDKKESGQQEK